MVDRDPVDANTEAYESDATLVALAQRLEAERPVPRPAFRGDLGRRLAASEQRRSGLTLSPRVLKVRIGTLAASGSGLLALAFAGVLGAGPLS